MFFGCLVPKLRIFPYVKLELKTIPKVVFTSVAFVAMIALGNKCLGFVQVSAFPVARSLNLLFNLILSVLYLKAVISFKCWLACSVCISGFIVGALDPSTLSLLGLLTGASSSFFQAVYAVSIKASLVHLDGDDNKLTYYNLLLASIIFFPLIWICGEGACFSSLPTDISDPATIKFWLALLVSAFLTVGMTFATFFCINVTSPVTYSITGFAKSCAQSIGGIIFLGETVTVKSLTGLCLTLGGSIWYSQIKMGEMKEAKKQQLARAASAVENYNSVDVERAEKVRMSVESGY
eukprot:CAMPEP_0113846022 /NCGR_PEP_ID=MMETSP0372-20130328/1075_1 /TAXON_ID=340204 /ORGANISM="Lankesteria abbotti" /LENGTH=292 /DNA_ID=CAMNT_0000815117 /DNA_START=248 /DNA_END=1126 /DNA_ORIENTATION=+ /assembly_acc=CAM_ASM_000359